MVAAHRNTPLLPGAGDNGPFEIYPLPVIWSGKAPSNKGHLIRDASIL